MTKPKEDERKGLPPLVILPFFGLGISAALFFIMRNKGPANLSGLVIDSVTQAPISGVEVRLGDDRVTYTNTSGQYKISNLDVDTYPISFFQSHYEELAGTVAITEGENILDVELIRKAVLDFAPLFVEEWSWMGQEQPALQVAFEEAW